MKFEHGLKKENDAQEKVYYCNDLNGFLLRLMYCSSARHSSRVEHSLKEDDPLWDARQEKRNPYTITFCSRNICVSQNIYHNISKIGASIYSPFELNKSLLKYGLREFDLFCCKSGLSLPFLLNRFNSGPHRKLCLLILHDWCCSSGRISYSNDFDSYQP